MATSATTRSDPTFSKEAGITAALLFDQFVRLRFLSILVLASGYLFDALMIVPHALTFPGAFSATGLLGARSKRRRGSTSSGTAASRYSSWVMRCCAAPKNEERPERPSLSGSLSF